MNNNLRGTAIRKIVSMLLCAIFILSLAGCGGGDKGKVVEENGVKVRQMTFSEYFNQDKPTILYRANPVSKDTYVQDVYIIQGNKLKSLEITHKTLGEFSKMSDDEILKYLSLRLPKNTDELSESDKETVRQIQKKYESAKSFVNTIKTYSIDMNYDPLPDLSNIEAKLTSPELKSPFNLLHNNILDAIQEAMKEIMSSIYPKISLAKFIDSPKHTVEYYVEMYRERSKEIIENLESSGKPVSAEDMKVIEEHNRVLQRFAETFFKDCKVEEDVNTLLDIFYNNNEKITMDDGHDILYSIKTDASGNHAAEEQIRYLDYDNNDQSSLTLYQNTGSSQITIYDSTYMPIGDTYGKDRELIVRVSENTNLVFDDLKNKDILVDADWKETEKMLKEK